MYTLLASAFFLTILMGVALCVLNFFSALRKIPPLKVATKAYLGWLIAYGFFIALGTGPTGDRIYELPAPSPYKPPWEAGGGSLFLVEI